jgi:nucleotide-binding universal stress UspA family protein
MSISVDPTIAVDWVAATALPAGARTVRHVLLALTGGRNVPRALRAADAFAQRLGAELHLLRVVTPLAPAVDGAPRSLAEATGEAQRVLSATRATRKLADRMLRGSLPPSQVCVRLGTLVDQVTQRACELEACIVIIPPGTRLLTGAVTEVARRTDCPVLVPKGCDSFLTLVAATDRTRPNTAAQLIERARRSVVVAPLGERHGS